MKYVFCEKNRIAFFALFIVALFSGLAYCDDSSTEAFLLPSKLGNEFIEKSALSGYLVMYDKVAWATSDTLQKYEKGKMKGTLGKEWFGYFRNGRFVMVYGIYKDGLYHPFVRYEVSNNGRIVKTETGDSLTEWRYAKAIHLVGDSSTSEMNRLNYKFNWYVYTDSSTMDIKVLYLPEVGPNFEIVYGNEFSFTIDKNANKVIKSDRQNFPLKYYDLSDNQKTAIRDENDEIPDVGSLYALERWADRSKNVYVATKKKCFALLRDKNGEYSWTVSLK